MQQPLPLARTSSGSAIISASTTQSLRKLSMPTSPGASPVLLSKKLTPLTSAVEYESDEERRKKKVAIVPASPRKPESVTGSAYSRDSQPLILSSFGLMDRYVTNLSNGKLFTLYGDSQSAEDQKQLRTRFEALFLMLDSSLKMSAFPFIVMAPDCTVVLCSPSMVDLLGYAPEELVGGNINVLMHDELAARHDAIIRRYCDALEAGDATRGHSTVVGSTRPVTARHKHGHAVSIEITVKAITTDEYNEDEKTVDSKGKRAVLFLGQLRDCTQEISLRATIAEAHTLTTIFPFPYIEANEVGTITRFNPAAEKTFGISAQRAMGKNVIILLPPKFKLISSGKYVVRDHHARVMSNYVSKVKAVGVENVKSKVIDCKTLHHAQRMRDDDSFSIAPEAFPIELEVKIQLATSGEIRFQAFIRDMSSFMNQDEVLSAVITSQAFPAPIVKELREGKNVDGERDLSVIFCDIVGFTRVASLLQDAAVLELLGELFGRFRDVKKAIPEFDPIKTNYDEFMAVTGLSGDGDGDGKGTHADKAVEAAFLLLEAAEQYNEEFSSSITIRVGIDSGTCMCGIIGKGTQRTFDIIGNTGVRASRAEQTSKPGKIHITDGTFNMLSEENKAKFKACESTIEFKNIGSAKTYMGPCCQGK